MNLSQRRRVLLVVPVILVGGFLAAMVMRRVPPVRPTAAVPVARATPSGLEIAAEDDAAPWSQSDGSGFANELVRAALAAAGVEYHMQVVPYARCKQMLLAGEVAACFSMSQLPELEREVAFSAQPLFVCYSDYVQRADDPHRIDSEKDLARGTRVGVVVGYEYPEAIYRLERESVIILESSTSEDLNLKKLADGRIDAAIVNDNATKPLEYMAAKAGLTGKVRLGYRMGVLESFIGFSRKHPRGQDVRERFDVGYRAIVGDGTHDRIERVWTDWVEAQVMALHGVPDTGPR